MLFAEIGSLDTIDTYVCTSIGSVIGTLLAVGLTPDDIWENLSVVTHDVLQYADIDKFFDTFGMDSGEYFMAEMIDILIEIQGITYNNLGTSQRTIWQTRYHYRNKC